MPIYDYACTSCRHVVEVIHGIHEAGPRFCPNCGAEGTMRKAFAPPAVHFKGSGWAKKDRAATAAPGRGRSSETAGREAAATGSAGEASGDGSGGSASKGSDASGSTSAGAAAGRSAPPSARSERSTPAAPARSRTKDGGD